MCNEKQSEWFNVILKTYVHSILYLQYNYGLGLENDFNTRHNARANQIHLPKMQW